VSQRTIAAGVTALSVEFVAKPQEAYRLHSAIPASIERTLAEVTGFSGCLVMTSDQEARLVTVLIFWSGNERASRCADSAPWIQKLLAPFMDHCLSVRSLNAYSARQNSHADFLVGALSVEASEQNDVALSVV
jgi:hypothetical protein